MFANRIKNFHGTKMAQNGTRARGILRHQLEPQLDCGKTQHEEFTTQEYQRCASL
jgi:hypothetical protein